MQHIRQGNGGRIIWGTEDWKAGLAPAGVFSATDRGKMVEPNGWQFLQSIDPFMNYGTIQPGILMANATNNGNLAGAIMAIQIGAGNVFYGIDAGGKVHTANYSTNTISSSHTISDTHSGYVGQDCMLYTHNSSGSPVQSLFYSYYDGTDWNIGCYVGLSSFDDVFMTTTATVTMGTGDSQSAVQRVRPHCLCVGSDDILYIGSGRYLHAYDGKTGSNGTFSSKVLSLPQGFTIVSIRKYNDTLLIAGNLNNTSATSLDNVGDALLYIWNYNDLDITAAIPLEDPSVCSLFIWKGSPAVITYGKVERNGGNKIKVISGNAVIKVADFDSTALVSNRGVFVSNDAIYINSDGRILVHGDKYSPSNAINYITKCATAGISGFVWVSPALSYPSFFASSSSGSTYSLSGAASGNGSNSAVANGFNFDPIFPIAKMGRIKSVTVDFFRILTTSVNNGTMSLLINTNYGTSTTNILTDLTTVAAPLSKRYLSDASGNSLPTFSSIALELTWNGGGVSGNGTPVVSSIIVDYEDVEMLANT